MEKIQNHLATWFLRALFYTSFPIMKQGKKAQRDEVTGVKKEWGVFSRCPELQVRG